MTGKDILHIYNTYIHMQIFQKTAETYCKVLWVKMKVPAKSQPCKLIIVIDAPCGVFMTGLPWPGCLVGIAFSNAVAIICYTATSVPLH